MGRLPLIVMRRFGRYMVRQDRSWLHLCLAILFPAALLLSHGCRTEPPPPPQFDVPELLDYGERFGGDFTLTDQDEALFDLSEHRGDAFTKELESHKFEHALGLIRMAR